MSEAKTRPGNASVSDFLAGIKEPQKRADCRAIASMMRKATGKRAKMWGSSIVGYGSYRYTYASGRQGEWMECGYAPRSQAISVYIMPGFEPFTGLMKKLGTFRTGKSCLYIKRLDDVDRDVLDALIVESVKEMRRRYPA